MRLSSAARARAVRAGLAEASDTGVPFGAGFSADPCGENDGVPASPKSEPCIPAASIPLLLVFSAMLSPLAPGNHQARVAQTRDVNWDREEGPRRKCRHGTASRERPSQPAPRRTQRIVVAGPVAGRPSQIRDRMCDPRWSIHIRDSNVYRAGTRHRFVHECVSSWVRWTGGRRSAPHRSAPKCMSDPKAGSRR